MASLRAVDTKRHRLAICFSIVMIVSRFVSGPAQLPERLPLRI